MARKYWFGDIALVGLALLISTSASSAPLADIQNQAGIRTAIETALAPRLAALHGVAGEAEVGMIDSRLRLPACDNIQVDLPSNNAAMITAKIICPTRDWTIYVPVRLHAWIDAVVAATNLAPNTRLTAAQLTRGRADALAGNAGLITDLREVEGKILRVGVMAGAQILAPQLDLPVAVKRGQKVVLTLTDPGMTIKTTATALEDGRIGDSISVENLASQKTFHATVARDGGVEIRF